MEGAQEEYIHPSTLEEARHTDVSNSGAGRQRPEVFSSPWAEHGFCFSIILSQIMAVREWSSVSVVPF